MEEFSQAPTPALSRLNGPGKIVFHKTENVGFRFGSLRQELTL